MDDGIKWQMNKPQGKGKSESSATIGDGDNMLFDYLNRLTKGKEGETEMKPTDSDQDRPSYWQLVFLQSKVNGAAYTGEELPGRNWDWPKDTYLQRRLRRHKFLHPSENSKLN
jgi:hypothetical protein